MAGLLIAASLPPWPSATGAWPLGVLGAGLLFGATRHPRWTLRLLVGVAAGVAFYGFRLGWMTEFHVIGYGLAVAVQAAMLGAVLSLVPPERGRTVGFPAALVLAEAVRAAWPLGGLPLEGLELGQVGSPFAGAARLGGRLLVVALLATAGVGVARLVGPGDRRRMGSGLAALAGVGVVAVAGGLAPEGSSTGRLSVAAVQAGGTRGIRAVTRAPTPLPGSHLRASRAVQPPVDLVLWPEGAVDVEGTLTASSEAGAVAALARRLETTVVAGVVEDAGPRHFANAAVAWAPTGEVSSRYDKVHRVPFGEYVPARGLLERLVDLSSVPRDALPGKGPGVLETPVGRLGVLVSYEVFFPERARAAVREGGAVLLVPTNASSYRKDQVPAEELAAARLRAIETGRWVVQAAPTGYSAIVDPRGRVWARSDLGKATVLQARIESRTGETLSVQLGTAPVVAAAGVALLGAWARSTAQSRWRSIG